MKDFNINIVPTTTTSIVKFEANRFLTRHENFEFKNIDEARDSKLATELFQFPFVKQVFIDENYVSVSKYEVAEWDDITVELREVIRNFITEGKQIVADNAKAIGAEAQVSETITAESTVELDETSQEIVDILEEYVKPAVASDGGNIMFQSYDTDSKTVNVILQGACSGCPSSTFTLKNGIETMLKNMMGDKVNEVVALNG